MKRKGTEGKRREKRRIQKVERHQLKVTLRFLISEYVDAAVAESWKGGGDPADIPVLDAQLELAKAKLYGHIEKMERECDCPPEVV